jgi:hypothetical protein
MGVLEYVEALKPHDLSVAVAVLELVRRADYEGALDRGEWLAAIRRGYVKQVAARRDDAGLRWCRAAARWRPAGW